MVNNREFDRLAMEVSQLEIAKDTKLVLQLLLAILDELRETNREAM